MHERLSWPQPPIWPEDLPLIRALMTEDEYAELCQRLVRVSPDGSLQDNEIVFFKKSKIELRKR